MFAREDDPDVIKLGMQLGAVEYIPKDPFAGAVLVETIQQMGLVEEKGNTCREDDMQYPDR
jgi:DNA-binding NarL/FixJ family response regulator